MLANLPAAQHQAIGVVPAPVIAASYGCLAGDRRLECAPEQRCDGEREDDRRAGYGVDPCCDEQSERQNPPPAAEAAEHSVLRLPHAVVYVPTSRRLLLVVSIWPVSHVLMCGGSTGRSATGLLRPHRPTHALSFNSRPGPRSGRRRLRHESYSRDVSAARAARHRPSMTSESAAPRKMSSPLPALSGVSATLSFQATWPLT